MFLDIAAFFLGQRRQDAVDIFTRLFSGHGSSKIHLATLQQLSLITCSPEGLLGMHDTLVDMAHSIMRGPQSPEGYLLHVQPWRGKHAALIVKPVRDQAG